MNFHQGDQVVHHSFGLGTIVSIEGMDFDGSQPSLFYRVDFLKTTVWVPLHSDAPAALRPLTPKSELSRYRAVLKSSPVPLEGDFRQRRVELEKRLQPASFQSLCEVVRDLNALRSEKNLNNYEKTLFKQTWEALIVEWSAVSGQSTDDAASDIDGCLN